jgi:hypothetical protein
MDKTLLFKAAEAAQGITAAQTAIEDRKRAVEEAKAAVEVAKSDLVEAKASYDAVIAEFVASGVPASKVKRNVEDFLRILGDLGFVESAQDEAPAVAEQKTQRRKKAEQPAVSTEPADTKSIQTTEAEAEGAAMTEVVEAESAVIAEEPPVAEETVDASVAVEVAGAVVEEAAAVSPVIEESPVETAVVETGVEPETDVAEPVADVVTYDIDNAEAFAEILDIIETITSGEVVTVSETLVTLLNAADWFSREWEKQPLDVQFYRDILNVEFVESALKQRMDDDLRAALVAVLGDPESIRIFEWFTSALDRVENGSEAVSYSDFATEAADEDDLSEVASAEPDDVVEDAPEAVVSDDVTLIGETVDDIGEINFLEDAAAIFAGATVETVVKESPAPAQASDAKPAEARSFRPRFLGSKG